jgi:hypothetical protein
MKLTNNLSFTSVLVLAVVAASLALPSPAVSQDRVTDVDPPGGPVGAPGPGSGTEGNGSCAVYADRAAFDADFPGLPIEDFEEGNVVSGIDACPAPLDETSDNACFSPGDILPGVQFTTTPNTPAEDIAIVGPGQAGNSSINVVANYFIETWIINFTSGTTATGMDLISIFSDSTVDIEVYGSSGLIDSMTASATGAGAFWGIANCGEPITQIVMDSQTDQAEGVDNIAFGTGAPTTGMMGMILLVTILALGSMGILYRRRHA